MYKTTRLIVGIAACLFFIGTAQATIWYVHPDSALNSIQAGIDSCSTGDTVLVAPGTYTENINFNGKAITVTSEYGADTTIIDGGSPTNPDSGSVVTFVSGEDTNSVLCGFTITNGSGTYYPLHGGYFGGGILCHDSSSPTIIGNTITGDTADWGGAIQCYAQCAPVITNNEIHNNRADTVGGGIFCYEDCSPVITGNIIIENEAAGGGGIGIMNFSSPIVSDNDITNNTAGFMGGGIYCYNYVSPTIEYNKITNNTCLTAGYGGGIRCSPNTSGVIRHCTISNNDSVGISIRLSSPDIDSCAIQSNTSHGIRSYYGSDPTINWCNIVDNAGYGLVNEDPVVIINAENNWWGDSTGPYHHTANPSGQGDSVSDYVDFTPWLQDSVEWVGIKEDAGFTIHDTRYNLMVSPNPFSNRTEIRYMTQARPASQGEAGDTRYTIQDMILGIYDATGRLVKTFQVPSSYSATQYGGLLPTAVSWDGTDSSNRKLGSGVYFLKLQAGDYSTTEKLLLIK